MGVLDQVEEEYVEVSSQRATGRELLELLGGSILFVLAASALTSYLLGQAAALSVAAVLAVVFAITIVSQTYWAVTGRGDYDG